MRFKLFLALSLCYWGIGYAADGRNQGAVNNLCQNLSAACNNGDKSSCAAYKSTGCACDQNSATCSRGNYSDNNEVKQ